MNPHSSQPSQLFSSSPGDSMETPPKFLRRTAMPLPQPTAWGCSCRMGPSSTLGSEKGGKAPPPWGLKQSSSRKFAWFSWRWVVSLCDCQSTAKFSGWGTLEKVLVSWHLSWRKEAMDHQRKCIMATSGHWPTSKKLCVWKWEEPQYTAILIQKMVITYCLFSEASISAKSEFVKVETNNAPNFGQRLELS